MSLRRVSFLRTFHSSPRYAAVIRKPFSQLPKRPVQIISEQTVHDSTRPKRGRKPKPTTQESPLSESTTISPKHPRNSLATEVLSNQSRYPHCILLTRVGQFYESYFDQASQVAHLLGIKLTSRVWDKQNVAMCGFPIMHLDKYLKILVQHHKCSVAMCEEFPRHTSGQKPEIDRRIVRIITPGTLIDESFLNPSENNYLLAISADADNCEPGIQDIGLAWIDVSTGEFFTKTTLLEGLKDDLVRISPREIVLAKELKDPSFDTIRKLLEDEVNFITYAKLPTTIKSNPRQFDSTYTPEELAATELLTTYMEINLLEHMPQLGVPCREGTMERMQIDSHTIKALEIHESVREGGPTGSLLSVIKRTMTNSGTRSLTRRLCSPSTSQREIDTQQSLVAFFYHRPALREDIIRLLRDSEDVLRIVQRFLSRRGEPKDLLAINRTMQAWITIQNRIDLERTMECQEQDATYQDWNSVGSLLSKIISVHDLSARITQALENIESQISSPDESTENPFSEVEQKSSIIASGISKRTIRPEFSRDLARLHDTLRALLERRIMLERELQIRYNAPSLTLRTNPAHGMHVHVGKAKRDLTKIKADPTFITISENVSTRSYFYQPWTLLGSQIVETTTSITNAEKEIFNTLRDEVNAFSSQLRHNARMMDELDVALSFANLAVELKFVRPIIKNDATYDVTDGRHPTVELGLLSLGRIFTPNSVALEPHSRLHVITGPNMAGKSTLLRQTALIAILAQCGSFVPAEHAVIGIVDKLFSRVGAKDDVFRDRSTFMVEMLETAEILRRATAKSLVIMDEVGRGTTVRDGLAIAFATVHHLLLQNRCRALFATHFHELADLLSYSEVNHHGSGVFRNVGFFCTDIYETEDNFFAYSHRLRPGVNRNSHGLKVAQLAGVPDSALLLAKKVLNSLQQQHFMNPGDLSDIGRELTTIIPKST